MWRVLRLAVVPATFLAFLATTVATAAALVGSGGPWDPVPDPAAVVTLGRGRFTILTPSLVRMEYARRNGTFDNNQTMAVVNRRLPVPSFGTGFPNTSAVTIDTGELVITYADDDGHGGNNSTVDCSKTSPNTDQVGGGRSPSHPDGVTARSPGDCCAECQKDPYCTAWVFGTDLSAQNCWLMSQVTGTTPASNRVFGGDVGAIQGFTRSNLKVVVKRTNTEWRPGDANRGNLNGTYSALDCYSNAQQCYDESWGRLTPGLLSRDGWAVLDDSAGLRLQNSGKGQVPWYSEPSTDWADLYFFGYGLRYKDALAGYLSIAGPPAIPPMSAFGVWWSRYWPYSQQALVDEVLSGYKNYSLPLQHLVLDMDWHIEPKDPTCQSWGGYTWNTDLFPNPQAFIQWVHDGTANTVGHPLKLILNVHPQTGVDHCQDRYPEFARANGVDPSTNQTVACNLANQTFAQSLFSIYLSAQPNSGVDYWWTDYGGCGPAASALIWNNHYFDQDIEVHRSRRPLVLSRYGGWGNHRYPIGFSGDTFQAWITLDFEVQTTPMAANVMFPYWSHDIGGFQCQQGKECDNDSDPKSEPGSQLLLRWIQFGAVAPVLRTHCDHCERRIWVFPHFEQMRDAFYLRNSLVPYIYTFARLTTYQTGLSLVRPMYHELPEIDLAYRYDHQYYFGNDVIAAPITQLNANSKTVWLPPTVTPEGTANTSWVSWNGTKVVQAGTTDTSLYGLQDIPLFARAGSVLPTRTLASQVSPLADPLVWVLFPGDATSGSGQLYEDDGDSLDYKAQAGAMTSLQFKAEAGKSLVATISPTVGTFRGIPSSRSHVLQLRGVPSSGLASVKVNGRAVPAGDGVPGWKVNTVHSLADPAGTLVVSLGVFPLGESLTVELAW